jgi:hypothetical protein
MKNVGLMSSSLGSDGQWTVYNGQFVQVYGVNVE